MSRVVIVFLLLFTMTFSALAAERLVETQATGVGRTENEALADALAQAVAQVNGVRSSISVATGQVYLEGSYKHTAPEGEESGDARIALGRTPDVRISGAGEVASYEKISSTLLGDGMYEVTVKAKIRQYYQETYSAPGSEAAKTRIAVVGPWYSASEYEFFGVIDGDTIARELNTSLESTLLARWPGAVLDRATMDVALSELGLVASELTNDSEKAKLRNIRGADILLVPTIREAEHYVYTLVRQTTGQKESFAQTTLKIDVRALVPATGELLFSRDYELRDAGSRPEALRWISNQVVADLVAKIGGGSDEAENAQRLIIQPVVHEAEVVETPRPTTGVKLPFDR